MPPIKNARSRLCRLLASQRIGDVDWYHQIGQCVLTLFPKAEGQHFYRNGIEQLAVDLKDRGGSRGLLFASRQFAFLYRPKDLLRLRRLKWTHIKCY